MWHHTILPKWRGDFEKYRRPIIDNLKVFWECTVLKFSITYYLLYVSIYCMLNGMLNIHNKEEIFSLWRKISNSCHCHDLKSEVVYYYNELVLKTCLFIRLVWAPVTFGAELSICLRQVHGLQSCNLFMEYWCDIWINWQERCFLSFSGIWLWTKEAVSNQRYVIHYDLYFDFFQ